MSKIADDTQELVIEDVTFDEARMNFNRVLQRLFKNMVESDSTDGSITLKIDVSLESEYIPNYDPGIEGESRRIQKPKFKHKVSSNITVKQESGNAACMGRGAPDVRPGIHHRNGSADYL